MKARARTQAKLREQIRELKKDKRSHGNAVGGQTRASILNKRGITTEKRELCEYCSCKATQGHDCSIPKQKKTKRSKQTRLAEATASDLGEQGLLSGALRAAHAAQVAGIAVEVDTSAIGERRNDVIGIEMDDESEEDEGEGQTADEQEEEGDEDDSEVWDFDASMREDEEIILFAAAEEEKGAERDSQCDDMGDASFQ
jgi:hypothetical protein